MALLALRVATEAVPFIGLGVLIGLASAVIFLRSHCPFALRTTDYESTDEMFANDRRFYCRLPSKIFPFDIRSELTPFIEDQRDDESGPAWARSSADQDPDEVAESDGHRDGDLYLFDPSPTSEPQLPVCDGHHDAVVVDAK